MNQRVSLVLYCSAWIFWLVSSFHYWQWFLSGITAHFDLLHAFLFVAITYFWFKKAKIGFAQLSLHHSSHALFLTLLSIQAFLFVKSQTTIRIFGFFTALTMAYGLLGFLLPNTTWKRGLIPFALLLMTLPFGRHLDVFIGYPLRMLSVKAAFSSLQPLLPDISTMSSLLVIENRASHVDMDCSGLKGLWVATLLYFLISWLETVKISLRWVAGLLGLWIYLVIGNFFRIVVLSLVHLYFNKPQLDPWIHHSLSVFFLLSGTAMIFWFLRKTHTRQSAIRTENPSPAGQQKALLPLAIISFALATIIWVPHYEEQAKASPNPDVVKLFMKNGWQIAELRPAEQRVYEKEGVAGYKFTKGANELIIVLNGDWRSQHKPELCYELSGLPLASIKTRWIREDFPLRQMEFSNRQEKAFYWFQCGNYATDDFAVKVWEQVSGKHHNWTQVSMLNRQGELPRSEVQEIYSLLKYPQHD